MAGKKYSAALAMVDRSKTYSYTEAVALAQKTTTTKFDSSVEVSFSLNVDPRQAEQNIRGALVLPNGTGRTQRVLVITQGPKGLMPNPKTGTVTPDVAKAIDEIKKGKVEYRVDKDGNLNVMIGKVSFTEQALAENYKALYDQIVRVKPATVKGAYIKGVTVSTTMGPGIKVTVE